MLGPPQQKSFNFCHEMLNLSVEDGGHSRWPPPQWSCLRRGLPLWPLRPLPPSWRREHGLKSRGSQNKTKKEPEIVEDFIESSPDFFSSLTLFLLGMFSDICRAVQLPEVYVYQWQQSTTVRRHGDGQRWESFYGPFTGRSHTLGSLPQKKSNNVYLYITNL